jgi:hypothetical protein
MTMSLGRKKGEGIPSSVRRSFCAFPLAIVSLSKLTCPIRLRCLSRRRRLSLGITRGCPTIRRACAATAAAALIASEVLFSSMKAMPGFLFENRRRGSPLTPSYPSFSPTLRIQNVHKGGRRNFFFLSYAAGCLYSTEEKDRDIGREKDEDEEDEVEEEEMEKEKKKKRRRRRRRSPCEFLVRSFVGLHRIKKSVCAFPPSMNAFSLSSSPSLVPLSSTLPPQLTPTTTSISLFSVRASEYRPVNRPTCLVCC